MRTLNTYFMPMGNMDLPETSNSDIVCAPDGGRLIGVSYNCSQALDIAGTADVLIDGADSGVDIDFPATVVDTPAFAFCDANLFFGDHTSIQLQSNEEPATGIFDCTALIRR